MFDKLFDNFKPKTELQAKKKQQQEYRLIGSQSHRAGHILFSINKVTGEIKQAEYKKKEYITWNEALLYLKGQLSIKYDVIVEKDCEYVEALNAENALKKYRKLNSRSQTC